MIGTVESLERKPGAIFFTVKIKLSTDFKKLNYVYVVNNLQKLEQEELEKRSESDN
jgi:rod shape-determining protein MreC